MDYHIGDINTYIIGMAISEADGFYAHDTQTERSISYSNFSRQFSNMQNQLLPYVNGQGSLTGALESMEAKHNVRHSLLQTA